jgi:hypothetical protein
MGARDIITDILAQFGLDQEVADDGSSLPDWAWTRYLETGDESAVMIELRTQGAFHRRFPAYKTLAERGMALSPQEIVAYERTFAGIMHAYGVPDTMFDIRTTVTDLLVKDVSATEVAERAALAAEASLTAPPEVRQRLEDLYGIQPGDMVAYWLNPDESLPKVRQRWQAAQVSGAAAEHGFTVEREKAEELAARGYTYDQARAASEQAAGLRGLTAGDNAVSSPSTLLGSRMGDAEAAREVERAVLSRRARGQGGGQAAESDKGVIGLGRSST